MENIKEFIEVKVIPIVDLYPNGENYHVYACKPLDTTKVKLNEYDNIKIAGEMPKLEIGREYEVQISESFHKKHGLTYIVNHIKIEIPTTIEQKNNFLRTILPPFQAQGLIDAYPNEDIVELIRQDKIDIKKVRGLGEITYPKVKQKVLENIEYQEALGHLSEYGLTYNAVKKLVKQYGSAAIAIEKVKTNPYVLTELDGFGFKTVDKYALKMGIEKSSPFRIISGIEYILSEAENDGHCWLYIDDVEKEIMKILEIEQVNIQLLLSENSSKKLLIIDDRICLQRNYFYEKEIKDRIFELLSADNEIIIKDKELKIKKIEYEQGFEFTDEQKRAIDLAIEKNVLIISGKAGSGKTSVLKGINKVFEGFAQTACALSGKAAQRINESIPELNAKTIHRLMDYHPEFGFQYDKTNPLPYDVVILDEGSMVNNYLFYKLISAIQNGKKFIIVGDIEQLPPIGAGFILKDLIDSKIIPVIQLTKVHRQALRSGILLAANHIRDGKQIINQNDYRAKIIGELKDLYLIPKKTDEEIFEQIIKSCNKAKENMDVMDIQVIVPMKNKGKISTKNLNIELQKLFNPEDKPFIKRGDFIFKEGDKVIQNKNNYDTLIFNGTMGIIERVNEQDKKIIVNFEGSKVEYTPENLAEIDLAYALTTHRCQGSGFKYVIGAIDFSSYMLLSRQLIYTLLTRAIEKCSLIYEPRALKYAISNNEVVKRNTFLKELLISA